MSLPNIFFAILLAGALVAGAAQNPAWVIVIIALLATLARIVDPAARAARAREGKGLGKALPMLVVNQIIWANLVFLIGYGAAWLVGGPLIPVSIVLPLGISAVGLVGMLATSLKG